MHTVFGSIKLSSNCKGMCVNTNVLHRTVSAHTHTQHSVNVLFQFAEGQQINDNQFQMHKK